MPSMAGGSPRTDRSRDRERAVITSWPACFRALSLVLLLAGTVAAQSGPVIGNTSFPPGAVGTQYAQGLSVSGGAAPYTWSITGGTLPPGLTLYSFGVISGIPSSGGTYAFTLTVTDNRQQLGSHAFSIVIAGPTFSVTTTSPLPAGTVGQNYNPVTLTAIGGTAPLTWAAGQGFPPGMSLSPGGVISGTPTTAGAFTFPVQATDAAQKTASATLSITIGLAPLSITTLPPLFAGTVGQSYAQTFNASGGKPPYTWSISGSLPAGLTINPSTGAVTGIPTTAGTATFSVQVADSASATAQQSFSITINPPGLNLIVVSTVPSGTVGVSYAQKLPVTASGGTPPYTWSLSNGSVPGLVFDPVAVAFNGTPTTPGTFNLTLQVADSAGLTATKSFSIAIAAAALGITTARQLPDGLNQPYSVTLAATGGAPPYSWSATGLPAGLSFNSATGILSGTPSAAGNFGLAITVQDSTLSQFSDRFTLNVSLPSVPAATLSGLPATAAPATQYPLTVTLANTYPADVSGQMILTFSPDTGPADQTIQFASGGTTASFTIPAGTTAAIAGSPLAVQTGTVSGALTISLRLQAGGIDITPSPAPSISAKVPAAAPVIANLQHNISGSTLNIVVTGYATSREITQAIFTFSAAAGQTLQPTASSITVDLSSLFGNWFQSAASAQFGTQFIFTEPFAIQGDPTQVIPVSVTLVNRIGQTTAKF